MTTVNRGQQEKMTRPTPCSNKDNYDIYTVIAESTETVQGIYEIPVETTQAPVSKCRFDAVNTERSNPTLGSVFGSGISGIFVGATLTTILFVVYNKRKRPDVNQGNSHQPSNERHRNYSVAIYCDPVECIESNRKLEECPKGILNPESLRRESQQNHSDFDQTSYSHLNEKGETDVILETNYDPVNFTQNAAKQPVNYDVCMAVDIPDAEKSFYELQEPFEQT
ncbi:uncharacterized protein LOC134246580 [Saccostrea cucullata]|uniref:uncharacterized protein LOC134246580 n=1 Tax=Saccostrea cuccullata TaxID=36930 RepID=UPI002ED22435